MEEQIRLLQQLELIPEPLVPHYRRTKLLLKLCPIRDGKLEKGAKTSNIDDIFYGRLNLNLIA